MQNSRASQTNKLLLYISLSICLGVLIGTQITGLDAEKTFFNKNFNLIFDNKELKINYLGRKYKEDQLLIFAEALAIDKPSSFEVNNTILTPFRKGQQNIVHFKAENFKKSFLMDASKTILTQLWNH